VGIGVCGVVILVFNGEYGVTDLYEGFLCCLSAASLMREVPYYCGDEIACMSVV
jgi:hypothetical protein